MATPVFVAEHNGSRLYRIGRAGYDSGSADAGGVYTGTLRSEKISPAGEDGLCLFRRIAMRIWRTGAFTVTMVVRVDGEITQVYAVDGTKGNQAITFVKSAPTTSPEETIIEASVMAQGVYVEVQIDVISDDVTGVFLPESLEVHYMPIRPSRSRSDAQAA